MRHLRTIGGAGLLVMVTGCVHVQTDPIKIEPVRIDIYHHVDKELEDFFKFEDQAAPAPAPGTNKGE